MGKKYVKKTVSKGTVSKGNKNIKHKKISSVGGSGSGHNTNNNNANNDNKQFGFVHWIARKIAELLIWLRIMEIPINNNGRKQVNYSKSKEPEKVLDFDNFYKRLKNEGLIN